MKKLALFCVVGFFMTTGCALTPMKLNIESPRNFNPIKLASEVLVENDWHVRGIENSVIQTNYKYKDRLDHRLRVRANVTVTGDNNFKIRFDKEIKHTNNYGYEYGDWNRTTRLNTVAVNDLLEPLIESFESRGARVVQLDN